MQIADQERSPTADRLILFARYLIISLYGCLLVYIYEILHNWWDYFGFTYLLNNTAAAYAACLIAALPSLFMPVRATNLLQFSSFVVYLLVFVPSMLVPVMQFTVGTRHTVYLFASTLIGASIFLLLCRLRVKAFPRVSIDPSAFWIGFFVIYGGMTAITLRAYWGDLSFAGLDNANVYEQRVIGGEIGADALVRYSMLFLANALNPFLIAYGLKHNKYLAILGIIGEMLMFSAAALRYMLLLPIFTIGIYYLADRKGAVGSIRFFGGVAALALLFAPLMLTYNPVGGAVGSFLTLLYMRTLLISGMAFGVYDDFFSIFPHTYLSQSAFMRPFVDYPYGDYSVGQVVGLYIAPTTGANVLELNANFIATDAIAAFGVGSIPFISAGAALLLWLMARAVPEGRERMAAAALVGFLITISNTSMLTALLTGGGAIIVALLYLAPDTSPWRSRAAPLSRQPELGRLGQD
jgi:hypothetical protein